MNSGTFIFLFNITLSPVVCVVSLSVPDGPDKTGASRVSRDLNFNYDSEVDANTDDVIGPNQS
jgi:hypothetical protein